jgi:hypothetical protein
MVTWFKAKLSEELRAMVAEAVSAEIERQQLTYQFVMASPKLTVADVIVIWHIGRQVMSNSKAEDVNPSADFSFRQDVAIDFHDSCFQNLLENILKSSLKLSLESEDVCKILYITLNDLTKDRIRQRGPIGIDLGANALRLSCAIVPILSCGLSKREASAVKSYALTQVKARTDLNEYERAATEGWIRILDWGVSCRG